MGDIHSKILEGLKVNFIRVGKPFYVFRLGSGIRDLEYENAANSVGIAVFMLQAFDGNVAHGEIVSLYKVVLVNNIITDYVRMNNKKPVVLAGGDYKEGLGVMFSNRGSLGRSVWYSFPNKSSGIVKTKLEKNVSLDDLRLHRDTMSSLSEFHGKPLGYMGTDHVLEVVRDYFKVSPVDDYSR